METLLKQPPKGLTLPSDYKVKTVSERLLCKTPPEAARHLREFSFQLFNVEAVSSGVSFLDMPWNFALQTHLW